MHENKTSSMKKQKEETFNTKQQEKNQVLFLVQYRNFFQLYSSTRFFIFIGLVFYEFFVRYNGLLAISILSAKIIFHIRFMSIVLLLSLLLKLHKKCYLK